MVKRCGVGLVLTAAVLLAVLACLYSSLSMLSVWVTYGFSGFLVFTGLTVYFKNRSLEK